ncbi:MAG TPA: hypothetical protein VIP77_21530 [Jiangellaceae bacterium]
MTDHDDDFTDVVRRLVEIAPPGWLRVVLDYEAEADPHDDAGGSDAGGGGGSTVTDLVLFAVVRDGDGEPVAVDLDYDVELGSALDRARQRHAGSAGEPWAVLHLHVDADGSHQAVVDAGPPRRLRGALDDTRFDDYVADHRADLDELARVVDPSRGPSARMAVYEEQIQRIVRRFDAIAPEGWVRLAGNWETYQEADDLALNYVTLAVVASDGGWGAGQLGYDEDLYDEVLALNEVMAKGDGRRWTVLDLEIDAEPAEFRVQFGYNPPKRVNGVLDDESFGRFERYLESWVAERGPTS